MELEAGNHMQPAPTNVNKWDKVPYEMDVANWEWDLDQCRGSK